MSIKSLEQRKRQQTLLIIGLGILAVAAVVLYFVLWAGKSTTSFPEDGSSVSEQEQRASLILEEKLKKIDLDFSFLIDTILPFLKSYGDLPVEKGTTGRTNPFIPY